MQVINRTPFAVAAVLWEDVDESPRLTLIAKATFQIVPGQRATRAMEQLPILERDQHENPDDPSSPLVFEHDRAPFKPKCDIIVIGSAAAPQARPVEQLDVRVKVGKFETGIRVIGDRQWWFPTRLAMMPQMSKPKPFLKMPLTYDRAFGGTDLGGYCEKNLIGRGFCTKNSAASVHGKPLPNLEHPADLIRSPTSRPAPVGFGFYGRGWQPRLGYAGTYDEHYRQHRAPRLPEDFDFRAHNSAHPFLQLDDYLVGDEAVELINLEPRPSIRFELAGIRPSFSVARYEMPLPQWIERELSEDREPDLSNAPVKVETLQAALDTLVLVPSEGFYYVIFRSVCELRSLEALDVAWVQVGS